MHNNSSSIYIGGFRTRVQRVKLRLLLFVCWLNGFACLLDIISLIRDRMSNFSCLFSCRFFVIDSLRFLCRRLSFVFFPTNITCLCGFNCFLCRWLSFVLLVVKPEQMKPTYLINRKRGRKEKNLNKKSNSYFPIIPASLHLNSCPELLFR